MLEYKHLLSLKTIQETDSLKDASKILNISLSGLSHQIKELESFYNCTFFIRKTNPIQFTSAGESVLELAEKVLPLFQNVSNKLYEYSNHHSSTLNIALECHSCYQWLLPTISEFRLLWPSVEIDLSAEFNFHPLPKLLSKELDLVITGDPDKRISVEYMPLFDFELNIAVSKKSKLATKKFLRPQDIADQTIITYPVEANRLSILNQFLNPAGIKPYQIRTAELTMMIIELVSSGKGISCLPSWVIQEFTKNSAIKKMKMGKQGIRETLYVAFRHEDKNHPLIKEFIKLAKSRSSRKLEGIVLKNGH